MLTYWSIFWRTFSALELAVIGAAVAWDWTSDFKASATKLAFLSLAPLIGAVVAAIYAYVRTPATTALEKAIRAFLQAVAGGLAAVAINVPADVLALPNLLISLGIAAVGAFLVTFFSNQGTVPPATTSP
jgi:lysylphosphatidylglycerol synthetase-like protein (DUF2156 family)